MTPARVPKQVRPDLVGGLAAPAGNTRVPQALSLALLEAQRGDCQCRPCLLLRKALDGLVDQELLEEPA